MMGFRLETATGRSAAIKAAKKHGAPATLDLEALLEEPPAKRRKWIQARIVPTARSPPGSRRRSRALAPSKTFTPPSTPSSTRTPDSTGRREGARLGAA